MIEDINVFAPHVLVLCMPIHQDFQGQISQPAIFWSEQPIDESLPLVSTPTELYARLQTVLQTLD